MRVTFLRRPTRAVLVVGPYPVLQRRDVEAKDQFLALSRVVLAAPRRDVPLVTAVVAARLTHCRAYVRHGLIVFMTASGAAWYLGYNGYGSVAASQRNTSFVLDPKASTRPAETHAALVLSTKTYRNLHYTVKLTSRQLRRNSPANPWEVGWFLWDYTSDQHFYYLLLKPNGWELGQENPHYAGDQRYLVT